MTRDQMLVSCLKCKNRGYSPQHGAICSITNEVANFESVCPNFLVDTKQVERTEKKREEEREENFVLEADSGSNWVLKIVVSVVIAIILAFVKLAVKNEN